METTEIFLDDQLSDLSRKLFDGQPINGAERLYLIQLVEVAERAK